MKKRFTFRCWNSECNRTYTLYREITTGQKIIVGCPYCMQEGVVDLQPFRSERITSMRGENGGEELPVVELQLPEIVPTQKPE